MSFKETNCRGKSRGFFFPAKITLKWFEKLYKNKWKKHSLCMSRNFEDGKTHAKIHSESNIGLLHNSADSCSV